MKRILLGLLILVCISSLAIAQGQGIHDPGTGIESPEIKEAGQGTGQGLQTTAEVEAQNQATVTAVRTRERVKAGNYVTADGEEVQVEAGEQLRLRVRDVEAHSELDVTSEPVQDRIRLHTQLSNGRDAEIKIMPNTASERALERLRLKVCSAENNCTIQLKEVGSGEQIRDAYEVQAQKQAKLLGLFKTKMQVQAQVDAETGEVIQTKKPWWAFLASESEE